jgi:hypothetical protein
VDGEVEVEVDWAETRGRRRARRKRMGRGIVVLLELSRCSRWWLECVG